MIDLHSHILPGLDDGARDWEQSLHMARMAVGDGIEAVVCTPHWVPGKYENTRLQILETVAQFREKLQQNGIPLTIYPGAELRLDTSLPERIDAGELLTFNDGGHYALIELPDDILPDHLDDFFWQLQLRGLKPVLSHVERHPLLRRNPSRLYRWIEMGILTQITAASLTAEFSDDIRQFSLLLLEHHWGQFLVTDAHGLRSRSPQLAAGAATLEALLGAKSARQMLYDWPQALLQGLPVVPEEPRPLSKVSTKSAPRRWFSFPRR